jgi:hypothetical protein
MNRLSAQKYRPNGPLLLGSPLRLWKFHFFLIPRKIVLRLCIKALYNQPPDETGRIEKQGSSCIDIT